MDLFARFAPPAEGMTLADHVPEDERRHAVHLLSGAALASDVVETALDDLRAWARRAGAGDHADASRGNPPLRVSPDPEWLSEILREIKRA